MDDLLKGFRTGFGVFEEKLKNKFAMQRLEKEAELAAKAREDEQAHASDMQDYRFKHDLDVQGNEFQNQLDVLGETQKHQTDERKDTQKYQTSERKDTQKEARGESAKLRKHQLKLQQLDNKNDTKLENLKFKNNKALQTAQNKFNSAEGKKDRDAARRDLIAKIKAEAKEGRLDRNSAKALSKMSTKRTQINIKAQKDMQRTGIKADRTMQNDRQTHEEGMQKSDARLRRRNAAHAAGLKAKEPASAMDAMMRTEMDLEEEYGALTDSYMDTTLPPELRQKAYRRAKAMHRSMQRFNMGAHHIISKGNADDFERYGSMFANPKYGYYTRDASGQKNPMWSEPEGPRSPYSFGKIGDRPRPVSGGGAMGGWTPPAVPQNPVTPEPKLPTNSKINNALNGLPSTTQPAPN